MEWLKNQIYHFNVLSVVFIILFSSALQKFNVNKELKAISKEIYENVEELKDEIRDQRRN